MALDNRKVERIEKCIVYFQKKLLEVTKDGGTMVSRQHIAIVIETLNDALQLAKKPVKKSSSAKEHEAIGRKQVLDFAKENAYYCDEFETSAIGIDSLTMFVEKSN